MTSVALMGFPHYQTTKVKWRLGRRHLKIAHCQCF